MTNLPNRLRGLVCNSSRRASLEAAPASIPTQQADCRGLEALVLLGLLSVTFTLSRGFALFSERPPDWTHLGAEYWNIARALNAGRGFADPFGHPTGPTSWMAPLYSLLLAGLLAIFPEKVAVARVVAAASNVGLAVVGVMVFRVARRHCHWLSPWFVVAVYTAWLCIFYSSYFLLSHDVWFAALVSAALVVLLSTYVKTGIIVGWKWGLAGGIAVLSNPSIALAWGALMAHQCYRQPRERRQLLWAGALMLGLASPWVVRNAIVFHRFIPTKSNSGYEAYQSNNIDDDGVYEEQSFWQHPYVSLEARRRYARLGEPEFVRAHQKAFLESVRRRPSRFFARVARRVLATTLAYPPFEEAERRSSSYLLRRGAYALPCLGALLALWLAQRERAFVSRLCIAYFAFLFPYWLLAFYVRHLFAFTAVLVLLTALGLDAGLGRLVRAWQRRRRRLAGPALIAASPAAQ
ncbi:MAG: hypothetical protein JW940_09810 [Polyangiaceae bacterium]|nr:hypothetical protein [Polyangiaceae bacterium]